MVLPFAAIWIWMKSKLNKLHMISVFRNLTFHRCHVAVCWMMNWSRQWCVRLQWISKSKTIILLQLYEWNGTEPQFCCWVGCVYGHDAKMKWPTFLCILLHAKTNEWQIIIAIPELISLWAQWVQIMILTQPSPCAICADNINECSLDGKFNLRNENAAHIYINYFIVWHLFCE